MESYTVALFGEAEKGDFRTAYFCRNLAQLMESFGNPPPESRGLYYAVQTLLYQRNLIFFRVHEEGFNYQDYLTGLTHLQRSEGISEISAICLPGVGDSVILDAIHPICAIYHSILITNEADFYDYLTQFVRQ